jgi:hypothetical protein
LGSRGAVECGVNVGASITRSDKLPRIELRLCSRNPVMIDRIMISAPTATNTPMMPIRFVRRWRM